jgi:diguanylate cyclase (GGDEF)-like protein/PAS domain S-box-containing protein
MSATRAHPYEGIAGLGMLLLAPPLLWWVLQPTAAAQMAVAPAAFWIGVLGLFMAIVAMLVFVTGYHAIVSARKGAVVLLGVTFLGVGLYEFMYAMNYLGGADGVMASRGQEGAYAYFFWLAARSSAALALLIYAGLPVVPKVSRLRKRLAVALILSMVLAGSYLGTHWPASLPLLVNAGRAPTIFVQVLAWLVVILNLAAAGVLWWRRRVLAEECLMALGLTLALSAVSALFVVLPVSLGLPSADLLANLYGVVAYLYLLHATLNESLQRPLRRLDVQRQREQLVISAAPDGVLWVDEQGQILMTNPAMETLTGYRMEDLIGQNISIFLPESMRHDHAQRMHSHFGAPRKRAMGMVDLKLLRRDGQSVPVDIALGHWEDGGQRYAIAYLRDQTARKQNEESLRHQATHDELTGLPNRWLFDFQLKQTLAQARRDDRQVAVLFLDLDDFKLVNDSFGHGSGDELLVQVGARLRAALRSTDMLARLGGDEFGILVTDLAGPDEAVQVAVKLLAVLDAVYRLSGNEVYVGGSIGLAIFPDDAQDSQNLLRYADMAMYQAKQAGRGAYACYSPQLDQRAHESMQLHMRLKEAIQQRKLRLLYQPQVDVASGEIVGAEALLRWHDEVLGDVSPARFVPIAETTGLILPLSDWVLETACRQIGYWHRAGLALPVAVNFSAQQFRQRDLAERVAAMLQCTGAPAELLQVEITESVAMAHPVQAREQIEALVALGCSVALDDFGTGYSSLGYLKVLPVSKLKIDRGFIKDLPHDQSDVKITRSIIALAHSMGMSLVAEGVETEAQRQFLRESHCETCQGWLFAPALEVPEMTLRLQDQIHQPQPA